MGAIGWRRSVGAAALALALLTAACGDDDSTSASATSTTARSTTTSARELSLSDLLGTWVGHGRSLRVDPDGTFEISYRTYSDCDQGDPPPCDRFEGDTILNGGAVAGRFTTGSSPHWSGQVTATSDPAAWPKGPVTASFDPDNDVIGLAPGTGSDDPYEGFTVCGDRSPPGYCGA